MTSFAHDESEADWAIRVRVDGVQRIVALHPNSTAIQHNGGRGRCLHLVSFEGDHSLDHVFGWICKKSKVSI